MQITFQHSETFGASRAAEAWCRSVGISYGSSSVHGPQGLLIGNFQISKWRNMTKREQDQLHGFIQGDGRNGPVHVQLKENIWKRRVPHTDKLLSQSWALIHHHFAPYYVMARAYYQAEVVLLPVFRDFVRSYASDAIQQRLQLLRENDLIEQAYQRVAEQLVPQLSDFLLPGVDKHSMSGIIEKADARAYVFSIDEEDE